MCIIQVNFSGIQIFRAQFLALHLRKVMLNAANIYLFGNIHTKCKYIYRSFQNGYHGLGACVSQVPELAFFGGVGLLPNLPSMNSYMEKSSWSGDPITDRNSLFGAARWKNCVKILGFGSSDAHYKLDHWRQRALFLCMHMIYIENKDDHRP